MYNRLRFILVESLQHITFTLVSLNLVSLSSLGVKFSSQLVKNVEILKIIASENLIKKRNKLMKM